jgi:hypothetical protein
VTSTTARLAAAAAVATASLAVAGCGGSDVPEPAEDVTATQEQASPAEPEAGAFAVDACSLLTAEQVSAATAATSQEGQVNADMSSDRQSICEWDTDASEVAFVQVVVSDSTASTERAIAEEVLGPARAADVPGTEDAYVMSGLAGAQDGQYFVQVTVVPDDDDAALQLLGLAAAALD